MPRNVRADGDLVYSAQTYRWTSQYWTQQGEKPTRMLADTGSYHLDTMGVDGKHIHRITHSSDCDDVDPRWSPDGKEIAFVRMTRRANDDSSLHICVVSSSGGKVTILPKPKDGADLEMPVWWPDGRMIVAWDRERGVRRHYFIDVALKRITHVRMATDFALQPCGASYCVVLPDHTAVIRSFGSSSETRLSSTITNPVWLDIRILIGETPHFDQDGTWDPTIIVFDLESKTSRTVKLKFSSSNDSEELTDNFLNIRRWVRDGSNVRHAIVEVEHDMSDGAHFSCYTVDVKSGQCHVVASGQLMGVTADGSNVIVSDDKWLGNYKEFRGGRRVGPIDIVNIWTGKRRVLVRG